MPVEEEGHLAHLSLQKVILPVVPDLQVPIHTLKVQEDHLVPVGSHRGYWCLMHEG